MLTDPIGQLRTVNATSAFNQWCGIEVVRAELGLVEIRMPWRTEAGQYAGLLHAGLLGTLIDTACGFAAATVAGQVLAIQFSVNCLRPAIGEHFVARAKVTKAGRLVVFTACELFAEIAGNEKLVATGETVLAVVSGAAAG